MGDLKGINRLTSLETVVGPSWENLVLNPLAVLSLNNPYCKISYQKLNYPIFNDYSVNI